MRKALIIMFSFLASLSFSQSKLMLYGKAKVSPSGVTIRLVAPDESQYRAIMLRGITLTRYEIKNSTAENPLILFRNVSHYRADDTTQWLNLVKRDTNKAGLVYNALFSERNITTSNPEKKKYAKMIFDLLMVSCDFDKYVAKACGLHFSDTTVATGTFEYQFTTTDEKGNSISLLKLTVNRSVQTIYPDLKNLEGKSKGRVAQLNWTTRMFGSYFGAYIVERSSDKKVFKRLNAAPLILMKSEFEKNKEKIFFNDTMPQEHETYYYRLRGLDFFGEESGPSNVLTLKNFPELTTSPFIDSVNILNNRDVRIHWTLQDTNQKKAVKKYLVQKSVFENKNFSLLTDEQSEAFTDSSVKASFYYRVGAITFYNDTIYSHARLAVIFDTIPPQAVAGLTGFADKKGNVSLKWVSVRHDKIKGYKVFKSNSLHEEFVQLNGKFVTDTFFTEKIVLNTLSQKVYYSVVAVDGNYNSSTMCTPIAIKRPDTIPPAKPVLFKVESNSHFARLTIVPSVSSDVERHLVYRKTRGQFELAGGFNSRDTIYYFTDSLVITGSANYKVAAIDESWNVSESNELSYYSPVSLQKKISDVQFTVDRREKHITLSWNYNEKNVDRFIVYRASASYPLTIIKSLSGTSVSFVDRELNIGNEYEYRIKAVFEGDNESVISDPVKIVY